MLGLAAKGAVDGSVYHQRPAYHITPAHGQWMNDPNGPMYHNGYYHLFYQDNPYGTVWGNMSWAHVVSKDLVHWSRLPIAMYNDQPYDIGGVFSGSAAITEDGEAYLFYTCVDEQGVQLQCVAAPAPNSPTCNTTLEDWQKSASNPIIPAMPSNWDGINFRDPTVWPLLQEVETASTTATSTANWEMIAAASEEGDGIIATYQSSQQSFPLDWTYQGALWSAANEDSAYHTWMVECPDLFPGISSETFVRDDGQLYVLKYSIMETRQEMYEVGYYTSAKDETDNKVSSSRFVRNMSYFYKYGGDCDNVAGGLGMDFAAESISDLAVQSGEEEEGEQKEMKKKQQQKKLKDSNTEYPALMFDYGPLNSFYASKTFFDPVRQQRVLWGWSPEQDGQGETRGWQGVQSLPRAVQLDTATQLVRVRPAKGLEALRSDVLYQYERRQSEEILEDAAATAARGDGVVIPFPVKEEDGGLQVELQAVFRAPAAVTTLEQLVGAEFGVQVRRSVDGVFQTTYGFKVERVTNTQGALDVVASLVMDSTHTGGSTPVQSVRYPIPTTATTTTTTTAATGKGSGSAGMNGTGSSSSSSSTALDGNSSSGGGGDRTGDSDGGGGGGGGATKGVDGDSHTNNDQKNNNNSMEDEGIAFTMQLFLDHSMTEIFVEDGALAATLRIYPDQEHQGMAWYTTAAPAAAAVPAGALGAASTGTAGSGDSGGDTGRQTPPLLVLLESLTVYSMSSIWTA